MNLLAISDLHLHPDARSEIESFLSFLGHAHSAGDQVVIAGDLFDLWFGPKQLTFEYQKPVLQEMCELSRSGLAIHYVEGNRDFSIGHHAGSIFRTVSQKRLDLTMQNRTIRFVHGDLVNSEDRMYRMWRFLSKNPLSLFFLDRMPSSFLNFGMRVEKEMKTTNMKFRRTYPVEHIETACRKAALEKIDVLVAGHFHVEQEIELQVDGKNMLFYNLPGWESGFRYLVIPEAAGEKPFFTALKR